MNATDPIELAIIGPLILGEPNAILKVDELLNMGFSKDHFVSIACKVIWQKACDMLSEGTFTPEKLLSFCNTSEEVGKDLYERSLFIASATPHGTYLHMPLNALEMMERKLRNETAESMAVLPFGSSTEVLDELESKISTLRSKSPGKSEDEKLEGCRELNEELNAMDRGESILKTSHVNAWDRCLGGIPKQQLVIVAGRPAAGKTSLVEQIIDSSVRVGTPILYIQRELSRSRSIGRLASRVAQVPWSRMEMKKLTKFETEALRKEVKAYETLPLYLAPVGNCNASTIAPLIKYHVKKYGVQIVVMDYIQLIDIPKGQEERIAIGQMANTLKRMTNDMDVTVMAIAQLSRSAEKRENRPMMSDIKDCGNIEQAADVMVSLWNEKDRGDATRWPVNWTIMKNRNGAEGTTSVMFEGPSMSFLGMVSHGQE